MSFLTAARNIRQLGDDPFIREHAIPIADNVKMYVGGIACYVTASGLATPAAVATTITVDGITLPVNGFMQVYDNTQSGHTASLYTVRTGRGCFGMFNSSAGDLIAQAQYGTAVYIIDDQTVAKTSGGSTRAIAGLVRQVDADGTVWVEITPSGTNF